jgi:hypothetical protein
MSSVNNENNRGYWSYATYAVPPAAAAAGIIPAFGDMVAKSEQQKGQKVSPMSAKQAVMGGCKAAPTVGAIVGSQMILQGVVERVLAGDAKPTLTSTVASTAVVGMLSSPVLAVFNGQTLGWGVRESLRKFTAKQGAAISVQETAFLAGLAVGDRLAMVMQRYLGKHKAVDYTAAFATGAMGSLAGHPANTALTRWQSGMSVSRHEMMWGSVRKARAVGTFAVGYKAVKEVATTALDKQKKS